MKRMLMILALLAPASAFADVVVLDDGQEIRGIAKEEGELVTVQLDGGTVSFPKKEVKEVRRENSALAELERRRAKLDPNDAAGRITLARWAEQNGMSESARELYREVIALRPDDPIARERLGYQKHEGRWLTEEELLTATGHVFYGGQWITREEADAREQEAAQRRVLRDREAQVQQSAPEEEPPPEESYGTYEGDYLYSDYWGLYGYGYGYPFYGHFRARDRLGHHGHHGAQAGLRGQLRTHQGPAMRTPSPPASRTSRSPVSVRPSARR